MTQSRAPCQPSAGEWGMCIIKRVFEVTEMFQVFVTAAEPGLILMILGVPLGMDPSLYHQSYTESSTNTCSTDMQEKLMNVCNQSYHFLH